jgi:hypothetical protein
VECQRTSGSKLQTKTAKYWREGNKARAIETAADGTVRDLLADGGVLKILEFGENKQTVGGSIDNITKQDLTDCDAFAQALFRLPLPNTIASVPLDQLIEQATRVHEAERRSIDGREYIILHFDSERPYLIDLKWKVSIYLDASVNYLVRRATLEHKSETTGDKLVRDYRIVDFQEVAPSIFFPVSAIADSSENGKLRGSQTTLFSSVVVNRPLPGDAFAFRFPHGLEIGDMIRGARYRVDAMGNRITEEIPFAKGLAPPPYGTAPPAPIAAGFPSTDEPTPWTAWLPYFFGVLLIFSVAAWTYSRWRERRAEAV